MKVKELIKILQGFDPDLPLITYHEEYGDQRVQKSRIKTQKVYRMGECLMLDFDGTDVPTPRYRPTPKKPGDLDYGLSQESGIVSQSILLPKKGDVFTYGDRIGIVVEARTVFPPDDFPKSTVKIEVNP